MMSEVFSSSKSKDGWLCELAPAKLNLFLHITGRRDDGYHELESVFAFTKFGDEVRVRKSATISLTVVGSFAQDLLNENPENNLVMKAAKALHHYCGESYGVEIVLEKNIPIAAGIGGGSSDAAATLRALIELWQVEIPRDDLMNIALALGADVPACIEVKTSFVSGIGENIRPIKLAKNFACVLVNAGHKLKTSEVFLAYKDMKVEFTPTVERGLNSADVASLVSLQNDLLRPACLKMVGVSDVIKKLEDIDEAMLVRMSGSGATCFVLINTIEVAEQVAKRLKKTHSHWWVQAAEFIS
jgi:4-diphosphocytidyl-2-C-methyl-D-erythritol kinase